MSNDSPIGSPMATKKTVSFDPNSTKKESATKVTIGNSMDFLPNQTTGKNLAAAVHEDAANYGGGSFKVRQSDQKVEGEMYDEKYATMKVIKKGETV
jgi:predicted secreted protein